MRLGLETKEAIRKFFGDKQRLSFVERCGSLADGLYLEEDTYVEEYGSVERLIGEIEDTVEGLEGKEVYVKVSEKSVEVRAYEPGTRSGYAFLWNIEENQNKRR
jgi:hypothetical protein